MNKYNVKDKNSEFHIIKADFVVYDHIKSSTYLGVGHFITGEFKYIKEFELPCLVWLIEEVKGEVKQMLTKQDLADWNSHPVTQKIFKEINSSLVELRSQSVVQDTVDQTAMQASYNEGMAAGAEILMDTYLELKEEADE